MRGFRNGSSIAALLTALAAVFAAFAVATATATAAGTSANKHSKKLKRAPKPNAKANFTSRGGINQAYAEDTSPGIKLLLVNKAKRIVKKGKSDRFGSKMFYGLKPGRGYRVFSVKGKAVSASKKFAVLKAGKNPPNSFYANKSLHKGLNYVTMRDGTELAMTVRLPSGKDIDDGPFPTLVEYSGYQTAAPHNAFISFLSGTPDDLAPATSTAVGSIVAPLLDFASVSVQMRGSGCSGGAFDLFGLPVTYDGYDAVETVGNQDWVQGNKVGMGGISFSGITQLFTAGTQPPHLAAIAPMSVTDDAYLSSVYPGGIFNDGFQLDWLQERNEDARPAPEGGQAWAKELTTNGDPLGSPPNVPDQHCIKNQVHLQARDGVKQTLDRPFRNNVFKDRSPGTWYSRIKVPVFLLGQFQDEQTSAHFAESLSKLKKNKNVWITLQNGVHADSLGPNSITRWVEFLNLFVADRIPQVPGLLLAQSGALYQGLAKAAAAPVEQSRFASYPESDVAKARDEFKKDPRIRVLMENGTGVPGHPGGIGASWEMGFKSWPVRQAKATPYYFGKKGALTRKKARSSSKASYKADPKARPVSTLTGDHAGGEAWLAQPPYNWQPIAKRKGVGFTSAALTKDTVIAGSSSVDLWLKSSAKDTDLQATLTEVRPDGQETYVQSGWLRASHRKLDRKASTKSDPFPTHFKKDAARLPKRKYSRIRIPVFAAAHAFRAGSKLRITVSAVGGDRAIWHFATLDKGKTKNTILLGGRKPSRIVLPVLAGADAQGTPLPAPTALRGEPSRAYEKASNGG
ncbi:MAG: CocE/NonD family hydrolase [Solirubrobacterales bacterium]|nr:CocE/NonD family hydrolase [Solirubrobacterales bacterium]